MAVDMNVLDIEDRYVFRSILLLMFLFIFVHGADSLLNRLLFHVLLTQPCLFEL